MRFFSPMLINRKAGAAFIAVALLGLLTLNVLTPAGSQAANPPSAKLAAPLCPALQPSAKQQFSPKASFAITPSSLPNGVVGVPYNASFSAGTEVVSSSLDGTLPPGLSFDSKTLTISGKPATTGTYNFTLMLTIVVEADPCFNEPLLDDISQSYSITIVKPEDARIPANLVAQLRVAPDRVASTNTSTEIVYTLSIKNTGYGKAEKVHVSFPLDPNLTLVDTSMGDTKAWVSKVAGGIITVEFPDLTEYQQGFTIKLIFHPAQNAKPDTTISAHFTVNWDDAAGAGKQATSNSSLVTLSSDRPTWNDTGGAVHWFDQHGSSVKAGSSYKVTGDFYAPNEWVNFWYTDKDGKSIALGGAFANGNGKISFEFSTKDWKPGQTYVVAGLGNLSQLTGSAALTVNA